MANESKAEKPKKRGIGRWFKEVFSELKKVTWPSFSKVVKQTGIVLAVVLFFFLVLMGMDALLGVLYKLLVSGLGTPTVTEALGTVMSNLSHIGSIGLL